LSAAAAPPVVSDAELGADKDGHVSLVDALLVVGVAQAVACRAREASREWSEYTQDRNICIRRDALLVVGVAQAVACRTRYQRGIFSE
jgi:hypothetical protein